MRYGSLLLSGLSVILLGITLCSCSPFSNLFEQERPLFEEGFEQGDQSDEVETIEEKLSAPVRPDNLFDIKPGYCLCRNGQTASDLPADHCVATCSDLTAEGDQSLVLRGEVEVANPQLNLNFKQFGGELKSFCNLKLDLENEKNLNCFGRLTQLHSNSDYEFNIDEITIGDDNRFEVIFTNQLRENKIYNFRILARSQFTDPGTNVESFIKGHTSSIQFKVKAPPSNDNSGGLLKVGTVKRYQCISRTGANSNSFTHFFRRHFIFDAATTPPTIPEKIVSVTCHNGVQGSIDNPLRHRLGEEMAFHIWDKSDRRFDGNGEKININKLIQDRLLEKHSYQPKEDLSLFNRLEAPSYPGVVSGTNNLSAPIDNLMGFILTPFVDLEGNSFPICPDEIDISRPKSDEKFDPIFNVLGEFIGATEALYAAARTPRQFDPIFNVPADDVLFINESLLKEIWFYLKEDSQIEFLDSNSEDFQEILNSKTIYFYWPADVVAPTVKKGHQEIYKIRTKQEIDSEFNGTNTKSEDRSAPLADRRIGCIPKGF